jgi:D-hydroxyproline dehydrogenase subunit gamma
MVPLPAGLRLVDTRGETVSFSFDDVPVMGFAGETLAAALLAAGIRALGRNPVDGTPRGLFCAMGACQECVVLVDGTSVEACRARVRDGMVVRRTG